MSTLSSWTAHVAHQQAEQEALQRAEDERLLAEIAASRRAREARKVAKYGRADEQGSSSSGGTSSAGGPSSSSFAAGSSSRAAVVPSAASSHFASSSLQSAAPLPRKDTRVAPPPLSLFPTSSSSSTAGKENPLPPRSASPTKALMSPTIQAAARFFEPPPSRPASAARVDAPPPTAREPLSPSKRSFNTPSVTSTSSQPAVATPALDAPLAPSASGSTRRKISHRATRSFAYAPSAPPSSRASSTASPSPPSTLSKASASRAEVQPLRAEPAAASRSAAVSRLQATSAAAARAELAALALSPSGTASSNTAAVPRVNPSPAPSSSRPTAKHRASQSVSVTSSSGFGRPAAAVGSTPRSIKDIIASLPLSSDLEDGGSPATPIAAARGSHRRAAQSISYLPASGGFAASTFKPSPTPSSAGASGTASPAHTPSPSRAPAAAPTVSRPTIVTASYSSTPSSRALAQDGRAGSPSVRDIIASFPTTAASGSLSRGMSTASSSLFRPKGHQRGSQSISYLPSTASRLSSATTATTGSSIAAAGANDSAEAASRLRTTSLLSDNTRSPAAPAPSSSAVLLRAPSPGPSTPTPRAIPRQPSPPAADHVQPARTGVPPSSSLTRLAGRGLVAQRVAHVPSELAKSGIDEGAVRERRRWTPPPAAAKERAALTASSPSKAVFQPSPARAASVEPSPASSVPASVFALVPSTAAVAQEAHTPRKYLRGPALPGLANPSSVTTPTSRRPLPSPTRSAGTTTPAANIADVSTPRPASPTKPSAPDAPTSSLDQSSAALPDMLKSPALSEGEHGLGFSGLSLRRSGRDDDSSKTDAPASPVKLKASLSPVSPRHVKLPSSPIKTAFEVVAQPPVSPSASRAPPSPAAAESPSSVKLTHPTRMRPKRPKAKKARLSFPPALVSPVRLPAPPVAVPAMSQARRRASGVVVPLDDEKEEEMQQVVRTPPSSWGRQDGRKVSVAQAVLPPPSPVVETKAVAKTDGVQDAKLKLFVASLLADDTFAKPFTPSPTTSPISTDVFNIAASGISSPLPMLATNALPTLYDTELLVFVHRAKDSQTTLVESRVWAWKGRRWEGSEEADAKVAELGRRYGAKVVPCSQGGEPAELMHILGQRLVTRQGWRSYFDAGDTALHAVKRWHGSVFVDQVDMLPAALSSRHPLVLTIIGQTFLYAPPGALEPELALARQYASLLAPVGAFTEFADSSAAARDPAVTGLFWMCLGTEEERAAGARADHWRFRPALEDVDDLRAWRVDCSNSRAPSVELDTRDASTLFAPTGISIVLCAFELYVVVGSCARSRQADITFALQTAAALAAQVAPARPFEPTVHCLVLPSQVPADLREYFRFLDDELINGGTLPRHMNLLTFDLAMADLQTLKHHAARLADDDCLPLGVAPTSS